MPPLGPQLRRHGGGGGGYDSGANDSDVEPRSTSRVPSRRAGLNDSVDVTRGGRGAAGAAAAIGHAMNAPYFADRSPHGGGRGGRGGDGGDGGSGVDAASDGVGGLSGLRDPYDQPSRSHLSGAQSRLRQDKASGALGEVAGRYRTLFAGQHLVRKGLRRSIADAYAAYVGQVVNLPDDTYALALLALDRTFSAKQQTTGAVDFNLHTSPFATSRAKHAQIFNTARKIMRDLEGYVYDVSYYCPGELDELRETRRRGGVRTAGGESYKSGPAVQTAEPPLHKEAVAVAPRTPATGQRPASGAPQPHTPQPAVNPMTGAIRQPDFSGGRSQQQQQQQQQQQHSRPRTALSANAQRDGGIGVGGGRDRAAAAVARSVAGALDAAAAAEGLERDGSSGPEYEHPAEERTRRDMRRFSSPGMYIKTPPHYKVSQYYDHVSPTKEVLTFMRKRLLQQAERKQQAAGAATDAAAAVGGGPPVEAGAGRETLEGAGAANGATIAEVHQKLALGARREGGRPNAAPAAAAARHSPPRHGAEGPVMLTQYLAPSPSPTRRRSATGGGGGGAGGGGEGGIERAGGGGHMADPVLGTDRIKWIVETAYELGLAEVLGLEGPQPYPRSRRISPVRHRKTYYEGLYSSPQRYGPAHPDMQYDAAGYYAGGSGEPPPLPPVTPPPPAGAVHCASPYGYAYPPQPQPHRPTPRSRYSHYDVPPGFEGPAFHAVHVAEARRYVQEAGPLPEAKRYPRSMRLSPR